jgi:putative transposase
MSEFLSLNVTATLLSVSLRSIQRDVNAGKYTTRQVSGRGGLRYEIALSSLPEYAQQAYQNQKMAAVAESMNLPALPEKTTEKTALVYQQVDMFELTDRQREKHYHRATVVKLVATLHTQPTKALHALNTAYQAGTLHANVVHALENSLDKGKFNALSKEVFYGWLRLKAETGYYAPRKREKDYSVQWWHDAALVLYRRPQKPTMQYVVEKLSEMVTSQGLDCKAPSYGQVDRFFKDRIGQKELQKGRNTGMKSRSLQAHKKRTAAGLEPWDEMQSDGWASHFTAPHPITGDYVTLEIWHAHDVATRIIPPLAVGRSENYFVIAKCLENATRFGGVMRTLQTDSTKIVKNNIKFVGDPLVSVATMAGTAIVHPKIVGNAQANGIAENFGVWLNNQAKELCSYQHESMDSLSFRRVQNLLDKFARAKFRGAYAEVDKLRKEIKRVAPGVLFESHQDALDWLELQRTKWNNHPHSALPKMRDEVTGKKRYQTPQESFDEFVSYGWQPVAMDEEQIIDLFRPRVRTKVYRGMVKPYSKKVAFYHTELGRYEGKEVIVAFDIMDGSEVQVMDSKGVLICVAKYDAPVGYRAQSFQEVTTETRTIQAIKRKEKSIKALKQQAGLSVIDSTASTVIDLKTVDYSRVEEPVQPLKQIEYALADDDAAVPKLRTLADLLAESSDDNAPEQKAPVPYVWGTVSDDEDDVKEEVL